MTLDEFNKKYEWLDNVYSEENIVDSFVRRLGLCRRFFRENRYNLTDKALERVLFRYLRCLNGNPDDNDEIDEIVELREKVCRRLAEKSFENYGEEWADALYDKAFHGTLPDSLADYDACIAVWERLIKEFGRKRELSLADCCFHAAVDCDCHNMYEKSIEYAERALKLFQNAKETGGYAMHSITHSIAMCHKVAADALMELDRYDEADERVEKAIEAFHKWGERFIKANASTVIMDMRLDLCNALREEIQERREKAKKKQTEQKIWKIKL